MIFFIRRRISLSVLTEVTRQSGFAAYALSMASHKKRIAIFGGSFDPVHLGHLAMVEKAKNRFDLEQVIFVPCHQSPFKGATQASGEQRHQMLEIAIEDKDWKWASVSDYEISRPEPSFSWKTAEHFSKLHGDAELFWILGTDQWEVIEQWAQPDRLREMLKFIVVKRKGNEVISKEGWRFEKMEFNHPASSTAIRADLSGNASFLSENVLLFCQEYELYSKPEKEL